MKRLLLVIIPWLFASASFGASFGAEAPEVMFAEAANAYNQGDVDGAIDRYGSILKSGFYSPELFFNLGNAHFRKGDVGRAVLNYRRALYLRPNDSEILGNYRFALEQAGALVPDFSPTAYLFTSLTRDGWKTVALAGYWAGFVLLAGIIWFRRRRTVLVRALIGVGVVMLISLGGLLHWKGLYERPELVAIADRQKAYYAPLERSTVHFEIPQGSLVRYVDEQPSWIKIQSQKKAGWIRENSFAKVYPWF